jgi:hypothetical protein
MNLEGLTEKRGRGGSLYFENSEMEIVMKACTKCNEVKTMAGFSRKENGLGRRNSVCKSCRSEEDHGRYIKNTEIFNERSRKWREQNPEKVRMWYEQNKERRIEQALEWQRNNKEKHQENRRKWEEKKMKLATK